MHKTKLITVTSLSGTQLLKDIPSDKNLPIKRSRRITETGTISIKNIDLVSLLFQGAPIWLFAFPLLRVSKIHILQCLSFGYLLTLVQKSGLDLEPFNAQVALIGRRYFLFGVQPFSPTLYLFSGSIIFLNDKYLKFRNKKCIAISDKHLV